MGEDLLINKIESPRKWRILVTPKEASESLSSLPAELLSEVELISTGGRLNDSKTLVNLLNDKDAVVLDLEPITYEILKNCPSLKVISRYGEGCDAIDLKSARNLGVRVVKTTGASSLSVARHTLSLILAITRHLIENDKNLKRGAWIRQPNLSEENTTLGILGYGKIGKAVADLAKAFGFNTLICSRNQPLAHFQHTSSLEELIDLSDILTIHLPLTPETINIISGDIIKKLKGKYLVNTARGMLVNEGELIKSLDGDGISGYATDAFSHEPISAISKKLARHPKVICSPHIAALDKITNIRVTERALVNALYCLNNVHEKVDSYVV